MKLKFCGIRRKQDAEYVNITLPDYVGFVFAPSRRYISPEDAAELSEIIRPEIKKAGVFVNESQENIMNTVHTAKLDIIQLHGDENEEFINSLRKITDCEIWKAVRVRDSGDIQKADMMQADKLMLDSFSVSQYGGTGKTADWNIIKNTTIKTPFFIAGGLNEQNILSAVSELSPFGLDISGGIETEGTKDLNKMKKITDLLERNDY